MDEVDMHNESEGRGENHSPESGTAPRLTLRKGEKLRHRSLVDSLFREGSSIYEFPIRLTWRAVEADKLEDMFRDRVPDRIGRLQMLITVPKKKRRHAVDRVLMRRRIREAYRLNRKELLNDAVGSAGIRTLGMAFVYMHDKNLPYSTIERKMKLLLMKLADKLPGSKTHAGEPDSHDSV